MSIIPMYKKCPVCKKMYSWNPDVGNMWCPNCGLLETMPEVANKFSKIKQKKAFDKKKNKK